MRLRFRGKKFVIYNLIASLIGSGGAVLIQSNWSPEEAQHGIIYLEMFAVFLSQV